MPPTTIRRWSTHFAPFLGEAAQGQGRKRFYTEADLATLARVRDLSAQNINLDRIAEQLAATIEGPRAPAADLQEEQPSVALALPGVLKEFNRIAAQLAQMEQERQQDREQIQHLQEQVNDLAAQLAADRRPLIEKIRDRFKRPPTDQG